MPSPAATAAAPAPAPTPVRGSDPPDGRDGGAGGSSSGGGRGSDGAHCRGDGDGDGDGDEDPLRRFVAVQRELLRLELHEEEVDEADVRAAAGGCGLRGGDEAAAYASGVLRDLRLGGINVGLCGRTVLDLVPRRRRSVAAPTAAGEGEGEGSDGGDGGFTSTTGKKKETTGASSSSAEAEVEAGDAVGLLPAHRFTVGDEVEIAGRRRRPADDSSRDAGGGGAGGAVGRAAILGVVSAVTAGSVSVVPSSGPGGRSRHRDGVGGDATAPNSGGGGGGKKGGGGQRGGGGGGGGKRKSNKKTSSASSSPSSYFDGDDDGTLPFDAEGGPLSLLRRSSGEVHRKLTRNLDDLARSGVDHPLAGNVVRRMFFYHPSPSPPPSSAAAAPAPAADATAAGGGGGGDANGGDHGGGWKSMLPPFNPSLDKSQLDAVGFALSSDDLALIHGPPGTGKTTAVVELILQAVHRRKWRVLVCAPSNVAVDNVLERLVTRPTGDPDPDGSGSAAGDNTPAMRPSPAKKPPTTRVVRLGHPARLNPAVLRHSLEELVRSSDGSGVVADARRELEGHVRLLASGADDHASSSGKKKYGKSSRAKTAVTYADRRRARSEIRLLRGEIREREGRLVREILGSRDVVFATNVGAASRVLDSVGGGGSSGGGGGGGGHRGGFDLVVIDEAAQALEASCWIPILRGRRVVLAGDHRQLPPTVRSMEASRRGLGLTMFDRAMAIGGGGGCHDGRGGGGGGGGISRMLTVQYRMHGDISDWSSRAMYGGRLRPAESVASRTLSDLPHVSADGGDGRHGTLLLIDTSGCDMEEETTGSGSRFNRGEARVVKVHVESLLGAGLRQSEIAIITPYNGQVDLLRTLLLPHHPHLEIRSVDGFQGGEREAVVLSLVRSSRLGGVGFLGDERRINVAVTRARRHCALVCDADTVSRNDFLGGLVAWMGERGDHRSALEFLDLEPNVATGEASEEVVARLTEEATSAAGGANSREEARRIPPRPGKDAGGSTVTCTGGESSIKGSGEEESMVSHPLPSVPNVGPHEQNNPQKRSQSREEMRDVLMDRIGSFAEGGVRGDELLLSDTLSKFERLVVHELAEELGLEHRSEGGEGRRRIILSIVRGRKPLKKEATESEIGRHTDTDFSEKDKDGSAARGTSVSVFSALGVDDSDDDSSSSGRKEPRSRDDAASGVGGVEINGELHDLARERMDRRRQQPPQKTNGQSTKTKKNKKKKSSNSKGKRLGGSNAQLVANAIDADVGDGDDLDDDMAFLDTQIERVQTSHGRKIEGTGSGYRSVINGILISKPKPPEKKRDPIVSSLMREKLRKAEEDRKLKKGRRKRK